MTTSSDTKMTNFQCFFFSPGNRWTGGRPTRPHPENMVGDQETGSPDRPVSPRLQAPCEPVHCRARTRPPW